MLLEKWQFMDALYMTIITIATVGYGEVHEVSRLGRIFTLLLIILGGGFFLYLMSDIIKSLVEGRLRLVLGRFKLENQIKKLDNHYIVCGYGRILSGFIINTITTGNKPPAFMSYAAGL